MKFTQAQANFSFGELGDHLEGRTDLQQYFQGASFIENALSNKSGGLSKRPGTYFGYELTNAENAQCFNNTFDFFTTQLAVLLLLDPSQATVANRIQAYYFTSGSSLPVTSGGAGTPSALPESVPTAFGAYAPSDGLLRQGTGYTQNVKIQQKYHHVKLGDFLIIVDSTGYTPPFIIQGTAGQSYYLFSDISLGSLFTNGKALAKSTPFLDENIDTALTITPSATTGSGVTLTASSSLFKTGHWRSLWRIRNGSVEGIFYITQVDSTTVAQGQWIVDLTGAAAAFYTWRESAWNYYQGFPTSVTAMESRIIFGGTRKNPDMLFGSQVNNYFQMFSSKLAQDSASDVSGLAYFGPVSETDAFLFQMSSRETVSNRWLSGLRSLYVGTDSAELVATGGQDKILSTSSVSITTITNTGSNGVAPCEVNDRVLYVSRDGKRVWEFFYSTENGAYSSRELTILNPEIWDSAKIDGDEFSYRYISINQMVWVGSLSTVFMSVTFYRDTTTAIAATNNLIACTVNFDLGTVAFSRIKLKNFIETDESYIPSVISLNVLKGFYQGHDIMHMVVKRKSAPATYFYTHEYMMYPYVGADTSVNVSHITPWNLYYKDCSYFLDKGSSSTTWAGLPSFYNGKTVSVLIDGKYHPDVTISGGGFTSNFAGQILYIGLNYKMKVRSMIVEAGARLGSAQGSEVRIDRIDARIQRGFGGYFGPDENTLEPIFLGEEVAEGETYTLYNTNKRVNFPGGFSSESRWYFEHDLPIPFTLLSVMIRGETNEV